MTKNFRTAFIEALEISGLSVAEIARRSGVSKDQLNKLKQREDARTNVDDARKIAHSFGKTLDRFIDDKLDASQVRVLDALSKLDPEYQDFLLNAAAAHIASQDNTPD